MELYELDLHGRTWRESLEEFIALYNDTVDRVSDPNSVQIRVIHGYGSTGDGGVLGDRLRGFCQRFDNYLEFTPGEQIDGNKGCTVVNPLKRLPNTNDLLAEQIWDYCVGARARTKIAGKFRRHGHPSIMQAIRALEKQGRLRKSSKKGLVMYEAH